MFPKNVVLSTNCSERILILFKVLTYSSFITPSTTNSLFDTSSVDVQNSAEFQNYKFIADKFLSDKNTVAECRSGINEDCKKYYKPVDVIKTDK